jgi:HEPN domain-containing protein
VEKYLKALLEEHGQPVPRTHILRDLQNLLLPQVPSLRSFSRGLTFLTRFAVGTRYPGDDATKRQALAAFKWAEQLRAAARSALGIMSRPRKRGKLP